MYRTSFMILSLIALPAIAQAQDMAQDTTPASAWTIGGSAALASDYVFRGFSQTDEEPATQASITATHDSGFAASLWGSNVDFNDGDESSVEIDATLSYGFEAGPGTLTVGGIYYAYPGADSSLNYDYLEGFVGYSFTIADTLTINPQVFYSPDFFAGSGDAIYATAALSAPLPGIEGLNLTGSVSRQWIEDNARFGAPDYTDWSAGIAYTASNKLGLSVKYYDTGISEDRCSSLCDQRIVAALTFAFP